MFSVFVFKGSCMEFIVAICGFNGSECVGRGGGI